MQAYSTYGGARRGTPVSTFIRVDDAFIRERCDIEEPDAIVCFDPSLLSPILIGGAMPGTVVLINSSRPPEAFADLGDFRFGTLDAIAVAQANDLGRFVNSAILGAFARMMGSPIWRCCRDAAPRSRRRSPRRTRSAPVDGYRLVRILGSRGRTGADPTTTSATKGVTA